MRQIRFVFVATLAATALSACATKGFVRKNIETQRVSMAGQLNGERGERMGADSAIRGDLGRTQADVAKVQADLAALRGELQTLRTEFGAKISAMEGQITFAFPVHFTWTLPPLTQPPDLLILATDLAGVGGMELPLEVSAIDSFASVTDAPERSLSIVARLSIELADVYASADEPLCATLDRCKDVSLYLLEQAPNWLDEG